MQTTFIMIKVMVIIQMAMALNRHKLYQLITLVLIKVQTIAQ